MSESDPINVRHESGDCCNSSLISGYTTSTSRKMVSSSSEGYDDNSLHSTVYQPITVFPIPSHAFSWVNTGDSTNSSTYSSSIPSSARRGTLEYSSILDIDERERDEEDDIINKNGMNDLLHKFHSSNNGRTLIISITVLAVFISFYLSFSPLPLPFNESGQDPYKEKIPSMKYENCNPGTMNDPESQKPFKTWVSDNGIKLPYYATGDLDKDHQKGITRAVIILHGFLRNANQYYCAAYNALMELDNLDEDGAPNFENTIVMAPQFLSNGDLCWDTDQHPSIPQVTNLDVNPPIDCGLPIWYWNQSWVNGQLNSNPVSSFGFPDYIYSYDVFNLMIDRLSDTIYFPHMKNITLFGFSAGGQTMQRYAIMPKYQEREHVHVRFVISDPSGFAYFDDQRPMTDGSGSFAVPKLDENEDEGALPAGKVKSRWILDQWKTTMSQNLWIGGPNDLGANALPVEELGQSKSNTIWGKEGTGIGMLAGVLSDWIPSWQEGLCYQFNEWRLGLKNMNGYLLNVQNEGKLDEGIKNYIRKDITYMIGWQDTCNCNLGNTSYNTHICYYADFNGNDGTCNDNMLEEECGSMLQGSNRYLRMINWLRYLEVFYGKEVIEENPRRLVKANVGHDYVRMIRSLQGACVIFGWNCHAPGVIDVESVTPGIYEHDEYKINFTPGPSYPSFPVPETEKLFIPRRNRAIESGNY